MSIKRRTDPAGLLNDHFTITGADVDDIELVAKLLFDGTQPQERIDALRVHPELQAEADRLTALLRGGKVNDSNMELQIVHAENRALYLRAAPAVIRDTPRQAGTKKKRGSRMPNLDAWLDAELGTDPDASNDALWRALPTSDSGDVFRDGSEVTEVNNYGRFHTIGRAAFNKRATSARKRRNDASN